MTAQQEERAVSPPMPFANTAITRFLAQRIDEVSAKKNKNQRQIAAEIGYDKPNIISMFKKGQMKVPLEKIPALARALDTDPAQLFRLAVEQYWPNQWSAIEAIFGSVMTQNEAALVRGIRKATNGRDPRFSPKQITRIAQAVSDAISADESHLTDSTPRGV